MPHPVIWFEVAGKDVAALTQFYGDLFGWKMEPGPNGYFLATTDGERASGGFGTDPSGGAGHVTFYAQTDDLQASLDKAESLGGKTVMPPTEVMEGTSIARFIDPEGHVIGLLKPAPMPE